MRHRLEVVSCARLDGQERVYRHFWLSCLIIALQVTVLLLLGRPWLCACGSIRLWQSDLSALQNSQQLTDPYSLLHLGFGCALFLWLQAIRPGWPIAKRATYAVMSSALWEVGENMPFIIQIFGMGYSGDSIANSLGDTLAVVLGFAMSSRLPASIAVSTILALEVATYLMIGDSVVATLLRIAGPLLTNQAVGASSP